jgi:hypothetical protein
MHSRSLWTLIGEKWGGGTHDPTVFKGAGQWASSKEEKRHRTQKQNTLKECFISDFGAGWAE